MSYQFFQNINLLDSFSPINWPRKYASATTPVIIDFNDDGQLDFAFHVWQGQSDTTWGSVTNEITPNKLILFVSQSDGKYKELTNLIIDGSQILPGLSRKSSIGDINQDGKLDWVYALNREDGRSGANALYNTSKAAALISQEDGTYKVVELGITNWYHSVQVDQNIEGLPLVILSGYYSGPNYGGDSKGWGGGLGYTWSETTQKFSDGVPLPAHPNTFLTLLSPSDNVQIITVSSSNEGLQLLELFEKRESEWVSLDVLMPYESIMVNFVSYSLDRGQAELFELDPGVYATAAGYSESKKISLFPGDESTAVFKFGGAQVDAPRQDGFYYQNDGRAIQKLDFYRSKGEVLEKLNINIVGEDKNLNSNFIDIIDFNKDGLEDIAVYPYTLGGQPHVYLNTGGNVFYKINEVSFPEAPSNWGGSASSKLIDLNSDGILDLFYAPMNGFSINESSQLNWVTYLGDKSFDSSAITTDIKIFDRIGSNLIKTWSGDDHFYDYNHNVATQIDGGLGIDTSHYSGSSFEYQIQLGDTAVVKDLRVHGDSTDTLRQVERLSFSNTNIALDINGNAGQAYRIYEAVLGRAPDLEGLGYWINDMDNGVSLTTIAKGFISSPEFQGKYGANPSYETYLNLLYNNILDRDPDPVGMDYWVSNMRNGIDSPAVVLASFSEGYENTANVAPDIANGIYYTAWIT